MATKVLLPKQGNSVESCIILEWKKKEGDAVSIGEPIVEVETDKATMDVESTAEGVILKLLVSEGDDVPVLDAIAVVGESGETVEVETEAAEGTEPSAADKETRSDPGTPTSAPGASEAAEENPVVTGRRDGRVAISPRARKLAESRSLDFSALQGSGPGGRIMVRDIESAIDSGATAERAAGPGTPDASRTPVASRAEKTGAADQAAYEVVQVKGVRKIIAQRMHDSLASTAQFTMNAGADARSLLDYRARLKTSDRAELNGVSINDLVMFAVSRVLPRHPEMNATYSDGVIRRYGEVNLGFAVDTEKGLMVPVIRSAQRLTLVELAAEAHRLADACKSMKAEPDELGGGTFSVTNLGVYGVTSFTPVLDAPQVGILGVGTIELKPVAGGGEVEFVPTLALSLTIDHQIVDGAPGARFLKEVVDAISAFELTLAQ